MARITVEDCLKKVHNRFELVLLASKRARELATTGADSYVAWEDDKATVVALREIAEDYITMDYLTAKPKKEEDELFLSMDLAPVEVVEQASQIMPTAGFSSDNLFSANIPSETPSEKSSKNTSPSTELTSDASSNTELTSDNTSSEESSSTESSDDESLRKDSPNDESPSE